MKFVGVILMFFVILLVGTVSALQEKMAIEECSISYNDDTYGPWDEVNHKGVFVKIINHNTNLREDADYEYINYQRANYQRAEDNGLNAEGNYLPILNIVSGGPNMIYTNCTHKVGNYRIYLQNYIVPFQGDGGGLHLSPDFDFNDGIIIAFPEVISSANSPANYNGKESKFRHYSYNLKQSPHGVLYYADNGKNIGTGANAISVYGEGFFPYTHPVMMTSINLSGYASGILYGEFLIREAGNTLLIDRIDNRFYLNAAPNNIKDFLAPTIVGGSITSEFPNREEEYTINVLECVEDTAEGVIGNCFDLSRGGKFIMTYHLKNPFNVPLNNIQVCKTWTTNADRMGFGREGTEVNYFWNPSSCEDLGPIPVGGMDYTFEVNIPKNNDYIWAGTHGYIIFVNAAGSGTQASYFRPGDDEENLLGFGSFDPRIEMIKEDGMYKPFFNLTSTLQVADTRYNYDKILAGDFDLLYEVWNGTVGGGAVESGMVKDSEIVSGATVFGQMGVSMLTQSEKKIYSHLISIGNKYISESLSGAKYYVRVYVIAKTGKFTGKKISTPTVAPYFTPGDIAYLLKDELYFGSNSKLDHGEIEIFNPTFYSNDFKLSVKSWSDEENFMLKLTDGVNYEKNPPATYRLCPLCTKKIILDVNATHNPWVSESKIENLKISVMSNLRVNDSYFVEKNKEMDFILNLNKDALNWFNLYPIGFSIGEDSSTDDILLDNLDSVNNEKVTLKWGLGSDSERGEKGSSYKVNVKLINRTNAAVLKEVSPSFTVDENSEAELNFDYDFSYGDYILKIELDSENKIAESFSSGNDGEGDNMNTYSIPIKVTGCWYNEEDSSMHRIISFGVDSVDKDNICECPIDEREFITDAGLCIETTSEKCANFETWSICNSRESNGGIACAWKCYGLSCPPQSVTNGACLNCSVVIPASCLGYNNKETCEADPCFRRQSYTGGSKCVWDSDNLCKVQITIGVVTCIYSEEIIQECDGINKNKIINLVSKTSGCDPIERTVACAQEALGLSFFTTLNLIAAISLITLFYFGRHFLLERKNR
jgi:hypothetical protein